MSRAVKMLFQGGWVTKEQFDQAMVASARQGETPGYHLVQMGAIADEDLVDFFVRNFPLRYWPRFRIKEIPEKVIHLMTPTLAKQLRVLPIAATPENLTVGLTDPSLTHVAEEAAYHTKRFVNPVLLSETDMTWALERYYKISTVPERREESKPPAMLERKTHDLIPADLASAPQNLSGVVNVTSGGWDIDEWGIADLLPDEDDAVPLHVRKQARASSTGHTSRRPSPPSERPSIFSIPAPSARNTLPPPPMKPSSTPTVRRSIAGMMLGISSLPPEIHRNAAGEAVQKSTDDLSVPRSIQQTVEADAAPSTKAVPAPSKKTIAEIMEVIHRSGLRDEVVGAALDFLLLFARRAAFLLVRKNEIRGYDIRGEQTNLTAIKSYWIPYDSDSTFRRTAESRQIHLGPFGRTVSDAVFSAALGGRPRRVLVIPITVHNRPTALLYADNLRIDMPPWNLLERIAEVTGDALYRLLMERRKQ